MDMRRRGEGKGKKRKQGEGSRRGLEGSKGRVRRKREQLYVQVRTSGEKSGLEIQI